MSNPLALNGLDAANPLGFLAALGTLRLCQRLGLGPRMGWSAYANSYRPRLHLDEPVDLADRLTDTLKRDLDKKDPPAWCAREIIKQPAEEYRAFATSAAAAASRNYHYQADLAAAYASDAATEEKSSDVTPTRYSFANGQSGKKLLRDYRDLVKALELRHVEDALFHPWKNADACKTFRWEPRDLRLYALRADDPGSSTVFSTHGANVLAFWGLAMLPSFPTAGAELASTGFARLPDQGRRADFFSWPIWEAPLGPDPIRAMLNYAQWHEENPDSSVFPQLGVHTIFRSKRINYQKSLYFSPAISI